MHKRLLIIAIVFLISCLKVIAQTNSKSFSGTTGNIDATTGTTEVCFPVSVNGIGNIDGKILGLESVSVDITFPLDSILEIYLKSPNGTDSIALSVRNNIKSKKQANFTNTVFTNNTNNPIWTATPPFTGSFLPDGILGLINDGRNADGQWNLCIKVLKKNTTIGTLNKWSLTFSSTPAPFIYTNKSSTVIPSASCDNAPLICSFDGYMGTTSNSYAPPHIWQQLEDALYNSCQVGIQNNSFLKFVAGASTVQFDISIFNSRFNKQGIQMFIYDGGCGSGAVKIYGCEYTMNVGYKTPFRYTATGLTPGKTYFLMFDGSSADVCDYIVQPLAGSIQTTVKLDPITATVCQGNSLQMNATSSLSGNTFSWTPSTGLDKIAGSTVTLNSTTLAVGDYNYTVTANQPLGGCPATQTNKVSIIASLAIITNPTTTSSPYLVNQPATPLTVVANQTNVLYQWYQNNTSSNSGGTAISGANASSYTPSTSIPGTTYYYCVISNKGCSAASSLSGGIIVVAPNTCSSLDTLVFAQQPTTTPQGSSMSPAVTVQIICKQYGNVVTSYNGAVTLKAKDGCGFADYTVNAVKGVATFPAVIFTRSVQTGVSLVASAVGLSVTTNSNTFDITLPTGGGITSTKTVASNDFESPLSGKWGWAAGTATYPSDDVTGIDCNAGNCYLRKSDIGTNAAGKLENKNTITFKNLSNLSKYTNLTFTFKLASLSDVGCATAPTSGSCKSADSGPGTDANEDMIIETSIDGGVSWQTLLTHKGAGNRLFPFASTPVTKLALGDDVIYSTGEDNSAFKVDITGRNQFQFRVTATNNRFSENWSIDDVNLIGDTTIAATTSPLPTVLAIGDTAICIGGSASLTATVTNSVGAVSYQWTPNTTDAGLGTPNNSKTSAAPISAQTYTLSLVDGDGCKATSNPVNITINSTPQIQSEYFPAQKVCANSKIDSLTVGAVNTESYQWYSNTVNSYVGAKLLTGENKPTFKPLAGSSNAGDSLFYFCSLGGICTPNVNSSISGAVVVHALPLDPIVSVTNPTCTTATGSVKITSTTTGLTFSTDGSTFTSYTTPYTLAAGASYSIIAKNSNGCISSVTTGTVGSQPASVATPTVSVVNPTCTKATGAVSIASATTGLTFSTDGNTYAAYTSPFTVASGASYSITAKNSDGCISSPVTGTVGTQPATPATPTVTITEPTCTTATGSIKITSSTTGLSFSTDATTYASYTNPYVVSAGASYSITAKNVDGCVSTATTGTINAQPATPVAPTVNAVNPTCTNAKGSVEITSSTTGLTFSTDGINYTAYSTPYVVNASGTYSITAKNLDGCISAATTGTVGTQPASIATPTVSVVNPTCTTATGAVSITSASTGLTFSTDGSTYAAYTSPFTVASGASYSITAKNSDGCISSPVKGSVGTQPATPAAPTLTITNPTCTKATGTVAITSTTTGLTFSTNVSTYSNYSTPYIVAAGASYSITAKNSDGCISSAATGTLIAQPATPAVPTITVTSPTCTDGNGYLNVTSTTTGLTFSTDGSTYAAYNSPYTVASGASYSITAKNVDGCISSPAKGVVAKQPATPATPNVSITNPTCTTATGSIKITSSTTGLTFSTDGTTYASYTTPYVVSAEASYSITAKNVDGCVSTATTGTINAQPVTPVAPTVNAVNPTCTNPKGSVEITSATNGLTFSTNGVSYASYSTPYIVNASAFYSITAKNLDGCVSAATTGTLSAQPATPTKPTVTITKPTCTDANGSVAVSSTTSGLTFSSDGSTYNAYSTPFTVVSGATYSITAKNTDGCISAAVTGTMATQPATPAAPTLTITNPTCTKATGTVAITSTTTGLTFSTNAVNYTNYTIPYTVAGGASYRITAKNAQGCISSAATGTLIAQPATPAVPTITVTSPTCTDGNGYLNVTSNTTGLTFSLDAINYASYSNPLPVAAGGSYSITAKNVDGCISSPAKGVVAKQPATPATPSVTVTNPTCTNATGFIKIVSSTNGLTFSTDATTYASYTTPYVVSAGASYSITAKNINGCISSAATGTINAQPATPATPTVTVTNPTCTNAKGSVEITSSTTGLTFSTNGITYAAYSTPYIVNANGSYSITTKNSDGCISSAITSKIGAQPATPATPKVLVTNPTCTIATGTVKIVSATTGLTFSADGTNYSVYSTPYSVAASANYSITAKNVDGCISTPAIGTLIAQPATPSAPSITVTDPSCSSANGIISITSTTTGLTFSTNGKNYASYANPYIVAAGTNYSITAKNADGCTSTATTGTMIAQPTPPKAFTVIGGGSYCPGIDGLAIALNNSESGVYYQLQKDGVNTGSLISGTGTALSFPKQIAVGTYTVTATLAASGCSSNMKGSAIIVNGAPKVLSVTVTPSTSTPCLGAPVTVSAKPTNAGKDASYEWKINDSIVQTGTLTTFTTKTLKDQDTISCLITSHIGCLVSDSGYSSKITFTVTTLPIVDSIKSTTNDTVCQNANITLTNKTLNGVWTSDKSFIATVDNATGVVSGVVGGIDSIKYTVSNKCGSVATKFGVHVINLSKLAPIEGDRIICKGTEIRLYNNLSGGVWSVDNRSIDTVASNGKVAGLQLGKDSVSYTYAGYCNTVTTKHGIKVIGKPLDPKDKDITIYPPKCLSPFSGSLDLNITGTESPYTYTFNGSTFPVTTSASGIGEGIYYLYIYNYAGCLIDSFPHVQFSSEGCDSLYIPTGFRPGSNVVSGKNNLLKPFGGSITTVSSLTFRVFNRFGNLLFVSNDLYSGWDGSFKGIAQEPGTYVWYLDYTLTKGNKKISLKGTSVLIR